MPLEFCSSCNQGYLKATERVVLEGETSSNFRDISSKRIYEYEACGQISVKLATNEYVNIDNGVKTKQEVWKLFVK
jgi:hypothetical protein